MSSYTNRFHKLAVMCPTLVTPEYKNIERYVWGLPERIQGNVTSSKPANIHEAVTMARGLVDQSVRAKGTRISESNKKRWEDQQRNNNHKNHNNTHQQQQNRKQEAAKAYVVAPVEGKGYQGNLPMCNRCNLHHNVQCPPKSKKCQRAGHQERDCRVKTPAAGSSTQQFVTCFGCGEKGHYKNKCVKRKDQ
ncbi:putative reverse transcriptase domain-containing protein [Tanacetum coccineum]